MARGVSGWTGCSDRLIVRPGLTWARVVLVPGGGARCNSDHSYRPTIAAVLIQQYDWLITRTSNIVFVSVLSIRIIGIRDVTRRGRPSFRIMAQVRRS